LDDLKEMRRYWKLKEEALDHSLWRTHFGRGHEPVIKNGMNARNIVDAVPTISFP